MSNSSKLSLCTVCAHIALEIYVFHQFAALQLLAIINTQKNTDFPVADRIHFLNFFFHQIKIFL